MAKLNFASLDKLENLQNRAYKDGRRKVGDAVDDTVGDALARATSASGMALAAAEGGVPVERIQHLAAKASNFGQFRMTLGNLLRGVQNRQKAALEKHNLKLTPEQCGDKKAYREAVNASKPKPAPKPPKVKAEKKPVAAKKGAEAASFPEKATGGAPSKQQAAAKGKGRKSKAAAGGGGVAAGVAKAGTQASNGGKEPVAVSDAVAAANS